MQHNRYLCEYEGLTPCSKPADYKLKYPNIEDPSYSFKCEDHLYEDTNYNSVTFIAINDKGEEVLSATFELDPTNYA